MLKHFITEIYTDGSNSLKTGKAGWGLAASCQPISFGQGQQMTWHEDGYYAMGTTNNRMELAGVYAAILILRQQQQCFSGLPQVTGDLPRVIPIYSDSRYAIDSISKWMFGWQRYGWRKKDGELKNADIFKRVWPHWLALKQGGCFDVELRWVKGHNGNYGNERADDIAGAFARNQAYWETVDGCKMVQQPWVTAKFGPESKTVRPSSLDAQMSHTG